MRISDWSSDVCSSDLVVENQEHLAALSIANQATQEANQHWGCQRFPIQHEAQFAPIGHGGNHVGGKTTAADQAHRRFANRGVAAASMAVTAHTGFVAPLNLTILSSEERRVGKECVCTCRYRRSPYL